METLYVLEDLGLNVLEDMGLNVLHMYLIDVRESSSNVMSCNGTS